MSGGTTVAGTAHWIAAVRARGSSRPDALFRDPQAEALSGEQGFAVMARSEQAAGGENAFIPVRVRWFDDGAEDPAALLAAGAGTRT